MHNQFLSKDASLARIITEPLPKLEVRKHAAHELISSIMSQQLHTKVAQVLHGRFLDLYGGKKPSMQAVMDTPFDTLRGIGLSGSKTQYILNVARFCSEEKVTDKKLQALSNEEIIEWLTKIKGVGRWTVEMLLIFTLGREDVFPLNDYGIQVAVSRLLEAPMDNKKAFMAQMNAHALRWAPYRSYASLHLWRWKDAK